MDLIKEMLQTVAEHAVSYRVGQTTLRHIDRTLWVIEKCARWAVPPPLDERPQPELIRPLPWVFFLMMLITLRITREAISLANLVMGKPPLRSADVVMYIQSKRRYLRTLKYQGNRMMRARTSNTTQPGESWYSGLRSMFEFTMCFRRHSFSYNNNTNNVSNNDEVLVVKRSKPGRRESSPVASSSVESTMERLIEKMMVDLNDESDEDSNYTLTNATSPSTESDRDTIRHNDSINKSDIEGHYDDDNTKSPEKENSTQNTTENSNNKSNVKPNDSQADEKDKNKNVNAKEDANMNNSKDTKTKTPVKEERKDTEKQSTPEQKPTNENNEKSKNDSKSKNSVNHKTSVENNDLKSGQKEPTKIPTKNQANHQMKNDDTVSSKNETKEDQIKNDQTAITTKNQTKEHQKNDEKVQPTKQSKNQIKNDQKVQPTKQSISTPDEQVKTKKDNSTKTDNLLQDEGKYKSNEDASLNAFVCPETSTPIQESLNFLQHEKGQNKPNKAPKTEKIVNGRTTKNVPNKKRGGHNERRDSDVPASRTPETTSL